MTAWIPSPVDIGHTAFWLSLVIGIALALGATWAVLDHLCERLAARFRQPHTKDVDSTARRREMRSRVIGGRSW